MGRFAASFALLVALLVTPLAASPPGAHSTSTTDCYEDSFCIESERQGNQVGIYVRNLLAWEFTMMLDMRIENATPDVKLPVVRSFPARGRTRIAVLTIDNPSAGWSFSFDMKWMIGASEAQHDPRTTYFLPYASDAEYLVGQGANGASTHQGKEAIDWDMPEGTEVRASRPGVVVDLEERFSEGGMDPALKTRANYVKVRHEDGTIGNYVHLRRNGVLVAIGDPVRAGQVIGYSGNTGYTSGPHLHFEVYTVTESLERRTLPIRFLANGQRGVRLEEGRYYGH